MAEAVNSSEQWVYDICRKSFLSIWSYINPQGRTPDKELCDILVVCDPHVLVVSVKAVQLSDTGAPRVDWDRWTKRAVDASIRQIKGAIRWLDTTDHVVRKDGSQGLPLPLMGRRVYHRIGVAFGGRREVPITPSSTSDDHVYHVFDEQSFYTLVRHLDTITDFTGYLSAKEDLLSRAGVIINGGEENLLAIYLHSGREFPTDRDMLIVEGDLWENVSRKPEFKAKLKEDEESYIWDRLIETFCEGGFEGDRWLGPGLSETEVALRVMACEDRFSRRVLGSAFRQFLELSKSGKTRARRVQSLSGVGYMFFAYDSDSSLEGRKDELLGRCFASLCGFEDCPTVIGIGINVPGKSPCHGYSSDLIMLHRDQVHWPEEYLERARLCRDELGYFKQPKKTSLHIDEYPQNDH